MKTQKRFETIGKAIKTMGMLGIIILILFSSVAAADTSRARGLDTSHWQHICTKWVKGECVAGEPIDWQDVYKTGKTFAWVKASQGIGYTDKFFKQDIGSGRNAGLKMGAYHFARPVKYRPEEEAQHFINTAKDYLKDGYLRPALDIEVYEITGENPCKQKVKGATSLTKWIDAYIDTIKKQTDVEPLIYTGHFAKEGCFDSSIAKYDLWFSAYSNNLDPETGNPNTGIWNGEWDFWQYTDSGSINNIVEDKNTGTLTHVPVKADMDVLNGDKSMLDKYVIHKPSILGISIFPSNIKSGEQLKLGYDIENLYSYTFDYAILTAQIKKSNSKNKWDDIIGDNKIMDILPGTFHYSKDFTIPSLVTPGDYDVKFMIVNSNNGNIIDSYLVSGGIMILPPGSSVTPIPTTTPTPTPTPSPTPSPTPLPKGPVYNVNKSLSYTAIQPAIDSADPGNEIWVYNNKIYYENVNINKDHLILRGIDIPVVNAQKKGSAIKLAADGITLEGFNVSGPGLLFTDAYFNGINVTSNNNILANNSASNNVEGIVIYSASNNTLINNTVHDNGWGIILYKSKNNILINNSATSNHEDGISLQSSSNNNVIDDNTLANNKYSDNQHNYGRGINIVSSNYNNITNNTVLNNSDGIFIWHSNNNKIYHNNIIDNTNQASDNVNTNYWNDSYPSGGNFWSDYAGSDIMNGPNQDQAGSDGIGDTSYIIGGNTGVEDKYPLMTKQ